MKAKPDHILLFLVCHYAVTTLSPWMFRVEGLAAEPLESVGDREKRGYGICYTRTAPTLLGGHPRAQARQRDTDTDTVRLCWDLTVHISTVLFLFLL